MVGLWHPRMGPGRRCRSWVGGLLAPELSHCYVKTSVPYSSKDETVKGIERRTFRLDCTCLIAP